MARAPIYLAPSYREVVQETFDRYKAIVGEEGTTIANTARMPMLRHLPRPRPATAETLLVGITGRVDGYVANGRFFVLAES